ncbi:hypothetical protein A6V39_04900 [Candidatus Mycoplasma haematobovis]|uniref:Alcohol dehydrogenase iron-type/glycerol dehydrogenase GldA domain-containing protein n=1 Tax=Candidatus Mycoplasma haematobovis TaxID=432608 RepID=A0A1A9QCZ0_9MOLU|nr:iron-containing alcohol dehydrogenase [Candidatus Mycoplasma haematobovis]OAL09881.1 hypothetical protein A6V39_04900 [Candidatus Mycoplasma haematobovis]
MNKKFTLEDLTKISDENLKDNKEILKHYTDIRTDITVDSNLHPSLLRNIIVSPGSHLHINDPIDLNNLDLKKVLSTPENKKSRLEQALKEFNQDKPASLERTKLNNVFIQNSITDGDFEDLIIKSNIRCVLLITDGAYTRNLQFYRRVIEILKKHNIPFIEYTNVQPNLDRKLVFRISEYANDHEVNAIITVGSLSTVDLAKIVLPKLVKPHLIRLHKTRLFKSFLAPNYLLISIPTLVVPDPKINSKSALKNNILFPNLDYFGDTIFLNNPIEDADAVFYCVDLFEELDNTKVWEILHETFFRLILNFFDFSIDAKVKASIVHNIKTIDWYLAYFDFGNKLNTYDKFKILEIIASTMDGSSFVDIPDIWIWYKLEASLSYLVNSKKCDGLALFLPNFLEVLSQSNVEFRERAIELGNSLYGSHSVEGFVYKLILHIKKYRLPISFLDIPQVKRVSYKFLLFLIKKSSNNPFYNRVTKTIVNNLTIW